MMDCLSTGLAAVSALERLPFTLGSKIASSETLWALYDATTCDACPVSIFEYDLYDESTTPLANNALRKLRTIQHPNVVKFIDVVKKDSTILIMTERVRPLSIALQTWSFKNQQERQDWLLWGLHQISVALAFINDSAASTHGCVSSDAIFISPSGEWKLGGFEVLSNPKDDSPVLYTMGGLLPGSMRYAPPEVKKSGWSSLKDGPISAADSYALGLLLHSVFSPTQPPPETAGPPREAIPPSVFPSFKELLISDPKVRMTPKTFLDIGMAETVGEGSGFFSGNRLVKVCEGLDNFGLGSEAEKATFLCTLKESVSSFRLEFISFRILPFLFTALECGGASAATILHMVILLGKNVSANEYVNVVLVPLTKLFASPDPGTRMALLDNLPDYADELDKRVVVDRVWPNLQSGFTDTVPMIREATIRAIALLSPKLNDRILNDDILQHLVSLQSDPEASIRKNACIIIGQLGPSLNYSNIQDLLVQAFSKAIQDPFVHVRVAGLMAFMETDACFNIKDVATKVIPAIASTTLDEEKIVRDRAFEAMELFTKRLKTHAASMSESTFLETEGIATLPTLGSSLALLVSGTAGAFTEWTTSAVGKRFPKDGLTVPSLKPISTPSQTLSSTKFGRLNDPQLDVGNVNLGETVAEVAEQVALERRDNRPCVQSSLTDVHANAGDRLAVRPSRALSLPTEAHIQAVRSNGVPSQLTVALHASLSQLAPMSSPFLASAIVEPILKSTARTFTLEEENATERARKKEERRLHIERQKEQKKDAMSKTKWSLQ